mgnify:FL=1
MLEYSEDSHPWETMEEKLTNIRYITGTFFSVRMRCTMDYTPYRTHPPSSNDLNRRISTPFLKSNNHLNGEQPPHPPNCNHFYGGPSRPSPKEQSFSDEILHQDLVLVFCYVCSLLTYLKGGTSLLDGEAFLLCQKH